MEKINLVEILKDCPRGMELYSPLCGDCKLYDINDYNIRIETPNKDTLISLYHDGRYCIDGEIMIFPKGKTTWEGFVPPCKFKDGDIIYIKDKYNQEWCSILSNYVDNKLYTYIDFYINYSILYYNKPNILCEHKYIIEYRLATKEEKERLFRAIKDNGYQWNPEAMALEKLIEPKFKVWYKIKRIKTGNIYEIIKIVPNYYIAKYLGSDIMISFKDQDEYELVPTKFDINTLVPFESRVLVRDNDYDEWKGAFWSHLRQKADIKYDTIRGAYRQCIPYKGNEHLLGTNNECNEYYKTWK